MPELVSIQNKSPMARSIVYNGRQIIIDGHGKADYDKELADLFMEKHAGVVTRSDDIGNVYEAELPNQQLVWLANMTGNPDVSEQVEGAKFYDRQKGAWQTTLYDNPLREPITIRRPYDPGQREYIAKDGAPEGINLAQIMIEIPPYTRRQLTKDIASWMLMRDGTAGKEFRGRLKKSRPPSSFEPDMGWDLDEMRSYLQLCSPGASLGKSEKELTDEFKDAKTSELEIDKAKRAVFTRLYFRLVDPDVRLPTRREFEDFMRGQKSARGKAA